MEPQLSFIGLGKMGRGMAKNIVYKALLREPDNGKEQAGRSLIVFNRTRKRCEDLQRDLPAGSVVIADSIDQAIEQSDIIFTCLSDGEAVRQTLMVAAQKNIHGKLFAECSTIHPVEVREQAGLMNSLGGAFVACPVFGTTDRAESGQLICVPAGPKSAVDRIRPYCTGVMGRAEINLSDMPPEMGAILKIAGNSLILNMAEALAESHLLAERTGLGGAKLHEYLKLFFPGIYEQYSNRIMNGKYWDLNEPLFSIRLARKDAGYAINLGRSVGVQLEALEVVDAHLAKVEDRRGGEGDYIGIYGGLREAAGLTFENR